MIFLTPTERALLEEVRVSDEDHGGLDLDELGDDETEVIARLLDRGLIEALNEFGEAPDGEEDEREAGGGRGTRVRITALGIEALYGHSVKVNDLRVEARVRRVAHHVAENVKRL